MQLLTKFFGLNFVSNLVATHHIVIFRLLLLIDLALFASMQGVLSLLVRKHNSRYVLVLHSQTNLLVRYLSIRDYNLYMYKIAML